MVRGIALSLNKKPQLLHRILILTGAIGAVFMLLIWLLVITAEDQLEQLSLQHWLAAEATKFEQDYQFYGHRQSLPNHYHFDIFFSESHRPNWLTSYNTPGFYEHHLGPEDKHFLVRPDPAGKGLFYVVFKDNADDYLDGFESQLHQWSLIICVSMLLLTFAFALYQVRQLALPLQKVLHKIRLMSPDQPDFTVDAPYQELALIEQSLADSKQRISKFFQREQEFSRFTAHEIRTPLMILQGSADLLTQLQLQQPFAEKASQRIRLACADIQLLTDTFLLLGQEQIEQHHFTSIALDQLIQQQTSFQHQFFQQKSLQIELQLRANENIHAPLSFVTVLLNNLLKNAFSYAHSKVKIVMDGAHLTISNDISSSTPSGYGYGLVIIERICERLAWEFSINSNSQHFEVRIRLGSE